MNHKPISIHHQEVTLQTLSRDQRQTKLTFFATGEILSNFHHSHDVISILSSQSSIQPGQLRFVIIKFQEFHQINAARSLISVNIIYSISCLILFLVTTFLPKFDKRQNSFSLS